MRESVATAGAQDTVFSLRAGIILLFLGALANALAPSVIEQAESAGLGFPFGIRLETSKFVLICFLAGLVVVSRGGKRPVRTTELIALAPCALGTFFAGGMFAWLGLAASSALLLAQREIHGPVRDGIWILLAASAYSPFVTLTGELFGGAVLAVDRVAAALLASLFGAVPQHGGTTLATADGMTLLLVWECGSLGSLLLVLLLWFTALRATIGAIPARRMLDALVISAIVVGMNALRLALMSLDEGLFALFHDGPGATAVRLGMISVGIAAAWVGVRHHVR